MLAASIFENPLRFTSVMSCYKRTRLSDSFGPEASTLIDPETDLYDIQLNNEFWGAFSCSTRASAQ